MTGTIEKIEVCGTTINGNSGLGYDAQIWSKTFNMLLTEPGQNEQNRVSLTGAEIITHLNDATSVEICDNDKNTQLIIEINAYRIIVFLNEAKKLAAKTATSQ